MKFVLFVTLIWSTLDSGWSITDENLIRIEAGLAQIQVFAQEVQDLRSENQVLMGKLEGLENENHRLRLFEAQANERFAQLEQECGRNFNAGPAEDEKTVIIQNTTIEERVTILENQMAEVQEDMMVVGDRVTDVEGDVNFLFNGQTIQDERIFDLEQDTEDIEERVEVLEANGGGGGNVTALEVRVETLEGTAAEHEADISDLNSATSNLDGRVETLEGETSELETRLTATETMIEALEDVDVELDSRISDLEEGGETTIAFRAVMTEADDDFGEDTIVIFSDVRLNEGNGYDPATGVFTVPSGGEGYYFFANHYSVVPLEFAYIDIRVNGAAVCTMFEDNREVDDYSNGGCNAVVYLLEGDEVWNYYWFGTGVSPVNEQNDGVYNGFTGFRI